MESRINKRAGYALSVRAKFAVETFLATGNGLTAMNAFVFPTAFMIGGRYDTNAGWLTGETGGSPHQLALYRNVNAYNSSIVMACINWTTNAFREATPTVYKLSPDGDKLALPGHRFVDFLRNPNPYYNDNKLWGAGLISYFLDGNCYFFKERNEGGAGQTTAIYYIPHYLIIPRAEMGTFITYYEYNVNGQSYRIPPDRIMHVRRDLDPYLPIKGRKILDPVLSEIYTDEEAAAFVAALLKNTAIPGVIIMPDTDKVKVDPQDALALKDSFKRKFGGANRGEPLITNFSAKVETVGFSPEQLQFKEVRTLPEERVCAQFQISPIVVGLGAGLDKSTFNNYEQAERHSYQSCLIPAWVEFADEIQSQLLYEFTGGDRSFTFEFDHSKVRALQESQDAVVARTTKLFTSNVMMRSEAREAVGLDFEPARDDVFYSDTKPVPVFGRGLTPPAALPPANDPNTGKAALFMLKAGEPDDNLNQALDMTQEADAKASIGDMEDGLDDMFHNLGDAAATAAKDHLDKHSPESESARLTQEAFKIAEIALAIRVIWGRMGKSIELETIDTVTLRLAITMEEAWGHGESNAAKGLLVSMSQEYETALTAQTKAAIMEALKGIQSGESIASIAKRIKEMVSGKQMYPGVYKEAYDKAKDHGATEEQAIRAGESKARRYRAKLIAETETRTYQNQVTLKSYQKGGVQKVKVTDGDGCGWQTHNDDDKAHNTIRLLSDAEKYTLAHPNCKRRFYPIKPKS